MYVCLCKALTEGDLKSLTETLGPDFQGIQDTCGVSTDCGSCRYKAEKIVREAAEHPQRKQLATAK